jgi:hypothetical protein
VLIETDGLNLPMGDWVRVFRWCLVGLEDAIGTVDKPQIPPLRLCSVCGMTTKGQATAGSLRE